MKTIKQQTVKAGDSHPAFLLRQPGAAKVLRRNFSIWLIGHTIKSLSLGTV